MLDSSLRRVLPLACVLLTSSDLVHAQDPPLRASLVGQFAEAGSLYADVWADGQFAYLGHSRQEQVDIVNLSDPANPTLAATIILPSPNDTASPQDVKVGDGLLFVALEYGGADGVAIYDVRDPYAPELLTLVDPEPGSFSGVQNLFYDSGWLYICTSDTAEVAIVDLRTYNPDAAPAAITAWDYRLQNVASTFVHDITVVDEYLYCSGWDSVWVYDVSDLGNQDPLFVGSERGITSHSVWPSADSTWVVTAEEHGGGPVRLYEVEITGGAPRPWI